MGDDGPGLDAVSKEAQPLGPESRHKTSHETQGDIFHGPYKGEVALSEKMRGAAEAAGIGAAHPRCQQIGSGTLKGHAEDAAVVIAGLENAAEQYSAGFGRRPPRTQMSVHHFKSRAWCLRSSRET